jgi:heme/copper-type cytochrome/quinol oxidase subunit 1
MSGNEPMNINIHDTYFVIYQIHLSILISILFGIIGLGYWIMEKTNRNLSKWLNLIHITLTVGGILLIWLLALLYRESTMDYDFNNNLTLAIYFIALISIFGQIVYPINLISGLIRKRK